MRVYSQKRRRTHSVDRMAAKPEPTATKFVALLRELARNQAQINNTQQLMEKTLKKLIDNKISGEQNGHNTDSMSSKANPHLARSQPSMPSFPPQMEEPHGGRQPTFEEMQEQLKEDWNNANFGEDISYKDYADLRMRYSGGEN